MRKLVIIFGIALLSFIFFLALSLKAYSQDNNWGYIPALPFYQTYRAEMYRHRGYWRGFNDPVPQGYTSKPVPTWNYRIIRQMERDRIRKERMERRENYGTIRRPMDSRRNRP